MPAPKAATTAWPSESAQRRLARESNLWLATVHTSGSAHLVPVWFSYVAGLIYVCTERTTVKVRNMGSHPQVAVSLESGDQALIATGNGRIVEGPWPPEVVEAFRRKYDWDIADGSSTSCLLAIEPARWLEW